MRDLTLCAPALISILAQTADQATWERLGIGGLSIGVTVFLWRHFNAKEDAAILERKIREDADKEERNRLLTANNDLTAQVVALLKDQVKSADTVARLLAESQKEFGKMYEDNQRSLKDITRKVKGPPSGFLAQEEIDPEE